MNTRSEGPVCPVTGDGYSNRRGKKKTSRNTEFYVPCGAPGEQGNVPRFVKLSEYKKPNKKFQPNRPAIWPVKPAAMRAEPTPRIHELAKPKPSYDDIKRGESERKSKTAGRKNAKGKSAGSKKESVIYADVPRFISLSEPKKLTTHYIDNRSTPEWILKPATLKARPSSRISELAKPKQLHKDWQGDRPPHTSSVR
ncbi:theg spermatid protein isoform X2 [Leucoraja erinacea]|uniref:theg spermatid protein isoform X2 n=1 Tax=Leucoraja erinaceus TaxID=7782 RepID=UPI0024545BFA|nr:theg spermatid protein isoform X2 [Leucoraja erinacea]